LSPLPYPSTMADLLNLVGFANRSLLWDRGTDVYNVKWEFLQRKKASDPDIGKSEFLGRFCSHFKEPPDFTHFNQRRHQTLTGLGAICVAMPTSSRLVIGLGLPHPTQSGFLLDRLTGCPYLPGSSVKGILRVAARLVASGDLEGDQTFWSLHLIEIFGPDVTNAGAARGAAEFYDALPVKWPRLEVDVLTPHYQDYYQDGKVPGDWDDPVPVPFLTVEPGTYFRFYFRAGEDARSEAARKLADLLNTALKWLGIGGKRSAGYGVLEFEASAMEVGKEGSDRRGKPLDGD